ncbi:hypothetical protein RsTz2092_00160 [Deferribacterales bacterium RsTz2092]|nr:hypothetical protein AGMMS49941_00350 [Deferribacterales bacterium]
MIDRDKTHLDRMNVEVVFIKNAIAPHSFDTFIMDDILQRAVCMSLINIGECASHLSLEFRNKHTELNWFQIIGVRNIAAHGYWQLNMEQIWQEVTKDIPELETFLNGLL